LLMLISFLSLLLLWLQDDHFVLRVLNLVADQHFLQLACQVRLVHVEVVSAENAPVHACVATEQVSALLCALLVVSHYHFQASNVSRYELHIF